MMLKFLKNAIRIASFGMISAQVSGLAGAETSAPTQSIVSMPIMHSNTAALTPKETAVENDSDAKLLSLVRRIRAAEAPNGDPDSEKLKVAGTTGCTWVKTGNEGGNKPTEEYQLFMAKMFVKQMCNPVSPVSIKAIPASPYDAFYPSHKDRSKRSAQDNKKANTNQNLLKAVGYDPTTKTNTSTSYSMNESSLENLIPLFSLMYSHGQRETSGNPTHTYKPTYEVTDEMGEDGILHQWNIGQGIFHTASNTLNFTSKINHPELTRIYSDYVSKLGGIKKGPQDEANKKKKFDQLCMASSFEKKYVESVGQKEYHNRIRSQKLGSDSTGVDIAWSSIKTYLSNECAEEAGTFMDKVSKNVTDAVEKIPKFAEYLDKNQHYQTMLNELAKLRREITSLGGEIKSHEIDANLIERKMISQKNHIGFLEKQINMHGDQKKQIELKSIQNASFFKNRESARASHIANTEAIKLFLGQQQQSLGKLQSQNLPATLNELEKINQQITSHQETRPTDTLIDDPYAPSPRIDLKEAEFTWNYELNKLLKLKDQHEVRVNQVKSEIAEQQKQITITHRSLEQALKAQSAHYEQEKINYPERVAISQELLSNLQSQKALEAKLQKAKKELRQFENEATTLHAEYQMMIKARAETVEENQNYIKTINKARREAASMAFFSLDNTDYSLSEDGILGSQDTTAKCFSALERYCPAFSADYHSVAIRTNNAQFGALNRTPRGITPSCANMFQEIYNQKKQLCRVDQMTIVVPEN